MGNYSDYFYESIHRNSVARKIQRCLTYEPQGPSKSGVGSQVDLTLNATGTVYWKISLHNKGAYMPGFSRLYGGDFILTPLSRPNSTMMGAYMITPSQMTYLDGERGWKCDEENTEIIMTECISEFVMKELNCTMPWMTDKKELGICDPIEDYERYLTITKYLMYLNEIGMTAKTGCLYGCSRREFTADTEISSDYGGTKEGAINQVRKLAVI